MDIQQLDVTVEDDISRVADHVKQNHGRVDFLLNAAAMLHPSGEEESMSICL